MEVKNLYSLNKTTYTQYNSSDVKCCYGKSELVMDLSGIVFHSKHHSLILVCQKNAVGRPPKLIYF